jgi:hypothetical protein
VNNRIDLSASRIAGAVARADRLGFSKWSEKLEAPHRWEVQLTRQYGRSAHRLCETGTLMRANSLDLRMRHVVVGNMHHQR